MEAKTIIGIIALCVAATSALIFVYFFVSSKGRGAARSVLGSSGLGSSRLSAADVRERMNDDISGKDYEKLKKEAKKKAKKKPKATLDELFFHAGMFTERERRDFLRLRVIAPIVTAPLLAFIMHYTGMDSTMVFLGVILGVLLGLQIPKSVIQRKIQYRADEILYYLPLVIEQIAIGVSSSLDIGPCLQRVVSMADERDSHNVVTEMMRLSQFYVKSGASLEHSLTEVGKLSGNTELKHAFMALSQVARHGGEISRQLQELADSVSTQRETKIEAKIKKLELEATGPVAMVFAGFLIILLIGFGLQLLNAF